MHVGGGQRGEGGESRRRPTDCSYVLASSSADPQETRARREACSSILSALTLVAL